MIELRNLSKRYHPRKMAAVEALKNLSFSLPSKGMVFVLGKSGSGKTTLLNLIGGLDRPTAGEIRFRDQSLQEISPRELDAYRNSVVGFVFQEHNLIDEFTVGQNLALAIELQGRKPEEGQVEKTLEAVGLAGYSPRKSIDLSGGQRQRIALARALIKNPSLILADEPTGSLDAETGKQIFQLLQTLATERLVVVITHDEDAARDYGERIIGLADGSVIRDVRRLPDGSWGGETPEAVPVEESAVPTFRHSRLPMAPAARIAGSCLFHKKLRLVLSLVLSIIAFSLFGAAFALQDFQPLEYGIQSLQDSGIRQFFLDADDQAPLDDAQMASLSSLYAEHQLFPAYSHNVNLDYRLSLQQAIPNAQNDLYVAGFSYFLELEADDLALLGLSMLAGELPDDFTEMAVPDYAFAVFQAFGFLNVEDEPVVLNEPLDLVGQILRFGDRSEYRVSGVVDTGLVMADFLDLVDEDEPWREADPMMLSRFSTLIHFSPSNMAFFAPGFAASFLKPGINMAFQDYDVSVQWGVNTTAVQRLDYGYIAPMESLEPRVLFLGPEEVTALGDSDIIVGWVVIDRMVPDFSYLYEASVPQLGIDLVMESGITEGEIWEFVQFCYAEDPEDEYEELPDPLAWESGEAYVVYWGLLQDSELSVFTNNPWGISGKDAKAEAEREFLADYEPLSTTINVEDAAGHLIRLPARIVGFVDESPDMMGVSSAMYADFLERSRDGIYAGLLAYADFSDPEIAEHVLSQFWDEDSPYRIQNVNLQMTEKVIQGVHNLNGVFWLGAIVFGTMAVLLVWSQILTGITLKQREIGILRVLGASRKDVVIIFLLEAGMMMAMVFLISLPGAVIATGWMNREMMDSFGVVQPLFAFSWPQALVLIGLALLVAGLATLASLGRMNRLQPIEVLHDV